MITIKRITTDDPLYTQAVDLRTRVLLAPIGYDIDRYKSEFPGVEERYEHFVAVLDHPGGDRVVGNACLLPHAPEDSSGKLSQMAVDPQRQNEGIGTKLVVEMERRATTHHNLDTLMCHAQIPRCRSTSTWAGSATATCSRRPASITIGCTTRSRSPLKAYEASL